MYRSRYGRETLDMRKKSAIEIRPNDVVKGNADAQPTSIRLTSSHHRLRFVKLLFESKINGPAASRWLNSASDRPV
jgi:hypothetical protein